jgi:heptosyltransferase III
VLFCIIILKNPRKILIVIQRSNGDVFLSAALIKRLYDYFKFPQIDLLVNDDTIGIAKMIPFVNYIHLFSYQKKTKNRFLQEKKIVKSIFKKYDLSISLTSSDRSVFYALIAGKKSIATIEKSLHKSWWKKLFLSNAYYYDPSKHILIHNLEPLRLLNIDHENIMFSPEISDVALKNVQIKFNISAKEDFIIFHPSSQYEYKMYPDNLRIELISLLNSIGILVLITGGRSKVDNTIKNKIPSFSNIKNLIGKTSLEEYFALSYLSSAYIGMDTLNMHIAAAQSKRIFAIFGPTKLEVWSPWSNLIRTSAMGNIPLQHYANVTIFQGDLPCVACGNKGCDNQGLSLCFDQISPVDIFKEVSRWHLNERV